MGVLTGNNKVASSTPPVEARQAVKDLLLRSAAFSKLPPETQHQIAKDTAEIGKRTLGSPPASRDVRSRVHSG